MPSPDAFARFVDVIARLRAPDGCPWDREQTPASLKPYVLEEAYELLEAIDVGEPAHILEELGDLLLQIVLQAQIASEAGQFNVYDVCAAIHDKIVRRHPHVFGNARADTAADVLRRWERIKSEDEGRSVLSGVPQALPALLRAQRVSEKAARVGFDWNQLQPVLDKLRSEIRELEDAAAQNDPNAVAHELGDVLFSVVNLARHLHVDAEQALKATVDRFIRRFKQVEAAALASGRAVRDCTLAELDAYWEAAKVHERTAAGSPAVPPSGATGPSEAAPAPSASGSAAQ